MSNTTRPRAPRRATRNRMRRREIRGNARLDIVLIQDAMRKLDYGPVDLARKILEQGYDGTLGSTERSIRYVLSGETQRPTYTLADHIARALGVQLELVTLRE